MTQNHGGLLFPATVVAVIIIVFVSGLFAPQYVPQGRKPVFVNHLLILTGVCACLYLLGGRNVIYGWGLTLTNEGRAPITGLVATLNMSGATYVGQDGLHPPGESYSMDQFLIVTGLGPPASPLLKNAPPPFLGSKDPLTLNSTVSNSMTLFQSPPLLQVGQLFAVAIAVTYLNGTVWNTVIPAQVFEGP